MVTKLIIVRHGNTFDKGDICTRVGARTDLPLSNSGKEQAIRLGKYFKQKNIKPDIVFTSELKRTYQTAEIALNESGYKTEIKQLPIFNEIDYGPDENKTEEEVIARIGQNILNLWDKLAIVPEGWIFDADECINNWKNFANKVETEYKDKTIMVVTSNGIARFSPYLTENFGKFAKDFKIKVSTGALCIFEKKSNREYWEVKEWNFKPKD